MTNFGFGEKWVGWMTTCISTTRISVLVNGSPTSEFSPMKGLRHGDPLSHFLFNIVVEGLNIVMERAKEEGLIIGASVGPNELKLSHLQFADDTIIFCEAEWEEVIAVKGILRCFELMSGLKINSIKVRYGKEEAAMWKQVVCSKYGGLGGRWYPLFIRSVWMSNTWQDMLSVTVANTTLPEFFLQNFKLVIGNGRRFQFWTDRWCNNQNLSVTFPRLFTLSVDKDGNLFDFFHRREVDSDWKLVFRRPLLAWEDEEVLKLNDLLQNAPRLNEGVLDSCSWLARPSGAFIVASTWKWVEASQGPDFTVTRSIWNNLAPPKVQFLSWLA
ncbi:uncharacterized protein LOC114260979 [Camellia sinensis]|uniref:uncharacterized protein LOC114260979 n=1 Tax=Camellia sinensis TaxID=4442 RepID=UPI0010369758|nr:uncharacterized protein LOC114260979 [Camellia sinensis]